MCNAIDDVLVVGGGDSGLLTALALDRLNSGLDVSVVDDFDRAVPEVGKSTFLAIVPLLHDSLGIDERRFVREVRPVWKASVYFRDWCDSQPFHYPFDPSTKFPVPEAPAADEKFYYYYDEIHDSPDHRTRCEAIVEQGTSPWYFDPRSGEPRRYDRVAYHLNTGRFNAFLREVCRERDVTLVDDVITGVDADGAYVERVRSEDRVYEADLFVDASGFNRVVRGELGGSFRDFEFPLDSAFNTRIDRPLSEIVPSTVVESGDHGWFWQIDTLEDRDLGYVFASEFVSDDDARAEFLEHCGPAADPGDVAKYTFDSGYFDRAWVGNCVTIGNAEGFVEPLQSTGLTVNAQAAVTLSNLLAASGRRATSGVRDTYNAWGRRIWESVHDFIGVHYRYASGDTAFWETMSSLEVSPRVEHLVEAFDRNGFDTTVDPTTTDPDVEDLVVFRPRNFYLIMHGMDATSEFYEDHAVDVSDVVRETEDERYRDIAADVSSHYTTREFYGGIVGQ